MTKSQDMCLTFNKQKSPENREVFGDFSAIDLTGLPGSMRFSIERTVTSFLSKAKRRSLQC